VTQLYWHKAGTLKLRGLKDEDPGMTITPGNTALVITDPQNDFLSPKGVTWGVVGESVTENNTVANIESLFKAAKQNDIPVFISPHYYYPTDKGWQFEGALETLMHAIGMFDRTGQLDVEGFEDSGADWLARYKPYIEDGNTIISTPHKVYGPENNDLLLQLRKRGIDKVILAGMSANLCTEAHLRELLERGFEVAVVSDGTAAAIVPEGDGYAAALVNFRFMAKRDRYRASGCFNKEDFRRLINLSVEDKDRGPTKVGPCYCGGTSADVGVGPLQLLDYIKKTPSIRPNIRSKTSISTPKMSN
jgi:nicotinamidase-related amidase